MCSYNCFLSIPLVQAVVSYHVSGTSKISVELLVKLPKKGVIEYYIKDFNIQTLKRIKSQINNLSIRSKHTNDFFSTAKL